MAEFQNNFEQPLGRILSNTGKSFLYLLNAKLNHLDIDRNYYALVLIDSYEQGLTQQELSKLLDTDKVSIVRIIDYLSDKGYVKRVKNVSDRRKYNLILTNKAKKEIHLIKDTMLELKNIAFKGISREKMLVFCNTIDIIRKNLNDYKKTL